MSTVVVIGSQWGDEGKGKIVDYLAEEADIVVRYSGGSNAGHTVVSGGKEYKLHLLPSGILYREKICVIANGVVLDPRQILEEIELINSRGVDTSNLYISDRAHVLFSYHSKLDALQEERKGAQKIGTTRRGIGPCYMDKMARTGIRMCDLMDKEVFAEKLKSNLEEKNLVFRVMYNEEGYDYQAMLEEYLGYAEKLRKYVVDTGHFLYEASQRGNRIMYEGAQATFLDIDHGTYPYVTSSNPIAGGVCTGSGVGPKSINRVVGVVKAYSTRVGEGPFITELLGDTGEYLRQHGHEFGATTGRPRRCGWLDTAVVRYAARLNSMEYLAVTRLDILDELPSLKICTGYTLNGQPIDYMPANLKELARCQPIYEELPGWQQDISGIREYERLPENAKRYLARIAETAGVPLGIVSVGPGRDETIVLTEFFV